MRVHAGPYLSDRERALALFSDWLKKLAKARFLDIVSVGSSQLSQSMFGEDWGDRPNGGGVPFNSEFELQAIREDAAPMLVRAYSATKNIPDMAKILERNLNMAWHALSLWWFNQIDGRGPLSLRQIPVYWSLTWKSPYRICIQPRVFTMLSGWDIFLCHIFGRAEMNSRMQ
jgi:hypothetical protein